MKKFFITLAIILTVFIVLPVALAFILFFDTGKMKVNYDDAFSTEKVTKALVVDSLDYTVSDQIAHFSVTESDINNMIYSATKDNAVLNKYLTQMAVDITDENYVISVSGRFGFFETRAKMTAELSKADIVKPDGSSEPGYVFNIKGISLGRLSGLKGVVMFFLRQFLGGGKLDAATESLHIHSDLDNGCLFIYASDLRQMIEDAVGGAGGGTADFYLTFINDFLDNNLLEFKFYDNDAFTVNIKLNKLTGNDYGSGEYVYYNMPYENTTTYLTINGQSKKLSLDVIREAIVSLLNNHLITVDQMTLVSNYLFNGYKDGNAPSCSLESIGITNKETYPGFNLVSSSSMDEKFKNAISSFDGFDPMQHSFDIANINESDVNTYLKTTQVFGHKFFLQRELDDGTNKVNYIALDNAYINFLSDGAIFSAGLNINGLETMITMPMTLDTENSGGKKLVYDPETLYFGGTPEEGERVELHRNTELLIFKTLKDAMSGATNQSFSFGEDGKLTISFDTIFDEAVNNIDPSKALYKAFLQSSSAQFDISVVGDNVTDNAVIKIRASQA